MQKLKIEYKYCECGCGKKVYPKYNSTIIPKLHPFCQAMQDNIKKKSLKQESLKLSKEKSSKRILNKKPSYKNIDKLLDDAWSELVKLRAGHRCEYCGTKLHLNSHHIYSRGRKTTKWDPINGICLCAGHHIGLEFSAHKTPLDFIEWLKRYRGDESITRLMIKSNQTKKFTYEEKSIMLEELRNEIKQLKAA